MAGIGWVILIILFAVFYFVLNIWDSYKLRKLREKHKLEENNDNRKKGEPPRRVKSITTTGHTASGATVAYQRELLPSTTTVPDGKTSTSNGKNTNFIEEFFNRFKKE